MKQSINLPASENGRIEETLNKGIKRVLLRSMFFMFLLASVMFFSSCYATVRAPRQPRVRHNVIVVGSEQNYRHDNGNHYGQYKYRKGKKRDRD